MAPLDLTFLATGFRQHVFTLTAEPDGPWVYKIPAAFGVVMPYPERAAHTRTITSVKKALAYAARRLPLPGPVHAARNRIFLTHFRWARRRDFLNMLSLLDDLSVRGLADVIVPHQMLRDCEASLRVDGAVIPYQGPMVVQRRVSTVFTKQSLEDFHWRQIIDQQHRLWRGGFGLTEVGEVLGYRSWALVNGHVRLVDTSSLTRDPMRARRPLRPSSLDRQERRVLDHQRDPGTRRVFEDYFRFVRQGIDEPTFDALWEADVTGEREARRGA